MQISFMALKTIFLPLVNGKCGNFRRQCYTDKNYRVGRKSRQYVKNNKKTLVIIVICLHNQVWKRVSGNYFKYHFNERLEP